MGNRFVVVALGALACGTKSGPEKPENMDMNPPPPQPPVPIEVLAPEPAPLPAPLPSPAGLPTVLNGKDAQGRTILRGADGACYIHLPPAAPKPGAPLVSFQPPQREATECPTSMKQTGWEACVGGTIRTSDEGSDCLCSVIGNPPPPPRKIACPAADG